MRPHDHPSCIFVVLRSRFASADEIRSPAASGKLITRQHARHASDVFNAYAKSRPPSHRRRSLIVSGPNSATPLIRLQARRYAARRSPSLLPGTPMPTQTAILCRRCSQPGEESITDREHHAKPHVHAGGHVDRTRGQQLRIAASLTGHLNVRISSGGVAPDMADPI